MTATMDNGVAWTRLSIKEILERVDLSNVTFDDESEVSVLKKALHGPEDNNTDGKLSQAAPGATEDKETTHKTKLDFKDPSTAFLGPKLWPNPISLPSNGDPHHAEAAAMALGLGNALANAETDYSVMDLEDFLQENELDLDEEDDEQEDEKAPKPDVEPRSSCQSTDSVHAEEVEESSPPSPQKPRESPTKADVTKSEKNLLPKADNSFLYAESKRARLERERAEKRRRKQLLEEERARAALLGETGEPDNSTLPPQVEVEFAPEDLALATVPGLNFDPKRRAFSTDELKPQPIIKKRKKNYVPTDEKDSKYWAKREKNNVAARRSREARRLKENQIALRAAYLEKENAVLRTRLNAVCEERDAARKESETLKEELKNYETMN